MYPSLEQANAYIRIMTSSQNRDGVNNAQQAINVYPSDAIQWQASTFSFGTEYNVVLYGFDITENENLIGNTEFTISEIEVPVPGESGDRLDIISEKVTRSYWAATTNDQPGMVNCSFKFALYDRSLEMKSYYSWNLQIRISQ